jgi:predicted TIM-barrel fold metal-dependent hydrolase
MNRRVACFLFTLLIVVSARAADTKPLAPLVDHHQHLLSPAAAAMMSPPLLPPITLPPELAALLVKHEQAWSDKAALGALYTADALVLSTDSPGWLRGRDAVSGYLSTRFARPYHLTPVTFSMSGNAARIAGHFTRDGSTATTIGSFLLVLEKADGVWRIATELPSFPAPAKEEPLTGVQLVAMLDDAGIQRAIVLSEAYAFDAADRNATGDVAAAVRKENDWTAAEAAAFPARLIPFCSVNPLHDYALAEVERCAANHAFKGLKLHFEESGVDLLNPEHVAKVKRIFAAANQHHLPIVVHASTRGVYGREQALAIVHELLPAAPGVVVQIAHLWGGESFSEPALVAFADAVAAHEPATKHLYFDVAELALVIATQPDALRKSAEAMRKIGLDRILYGSDGPRFGNVEPAQAWADFMKLVPLTPAEFATIAKNVAPYLR